MTTAKLPSPATASPDAPASFFMVTVVQVLVYSGASKQMFVLRLVGRPDTATGPARCRDRSPDGDDDRLTGAGLFRCVADLSEGRRRVGGEGAVDEAPCGAPYIVRQ